MRLLKLAYLFLKNLLEAPRGRSGAGVRSEAFTKRILNCVIIGRLMGLDRIFGCMEAGTSVFIGTVGASGMPSCVRAIGVRSDDDLATATIYLPMATSRETLANLATTHRLAVVATRPIEHAAIQLKGSSITARLARDDEEAFVRSRLEGLADVLDSLGVPRRVTKSFAVWPAFAIEMRVEHIFEQTPGPKAGTCLR